ncbi:hypothetical protein HDU97_005921 [Phlyctochytrium planicorne]|nr:hypothetical protein HDU97_005921 [Phlyctochytrium planicorne]
MQQQQPVKNDNFYDQAKAYDQSYNIPPAVEVTAVVTPQLLPEVALKNRRYIMTSLICTSIGVLLVIIAAATEWILIGRKGKDPFVRYSPGKIRSCDEDGCTIPRGSVCDVAKGAFGSQKGNFCELDEALRGLTITSAVFGSIAIIPMLYVFRMNQAAMTRTTYYMAAGFPLLTASMAFGCMIVGIMLLQVPALKNLRGADASLGAGFYMDVIALIFYLCTGSLMFLISRTAPTVVDAALRAQAHSNLFKIGRTAQAQSGAAVYGDQPAGLYATHATAQQPQQPAYGQPYPDQQQQQYQQQYAQPQQQYAQPQQQYAQPQQQYAQPQYGQQQPQQQYAQSQYGQPQAYGQ